MILPRNELSEAEEEGSIIKLSRMSITQNAERNVNRKSVLYSLNGSEDALLLHYITTPSVQTP